MSNCECGEPISDLDGRLDELTRVLAQFSDLDGLIQDCRLFEFALAFIDPDTPGAVQALACAPLWRAIADVATEVRILCEVRDGNQN